MEKSDELKKEIINHKVLVKGDTEFRAYARLQQSKWRTEKGFAMGKSQNGTYYGNYLTTEDTKKQKNFLTDNIRHQVDKAIENKDSKSIIDEERLFTNLLSSQPLCFNLFGELAVDLKLATSFFKEIFPNKIGQVVNILFEHSKWREDKRFTGDKSAFDVFVEYEQDNKKGFIGIEVKYAESLREEDTATSQRIFEAHKSEYLRWTNGEIFKPDSIELLSKPPLCQIWRDHLLAISVLGNRVYDEGIFVFLYPKGNIQCEHGVKMYNELLISDDPYMTKFYPTHLDDYINTLHCLIGTNWTAELKNRYLGE